MSIGCFKPSLRDIYSSSVWIAADTNGIGASICDVAGVHKLGFRMVSCLGIVQERIGSHFR